MSIAESLRATLLGITQISSLIGEEKELCDALQERFNKSLGSQAITRYQDSLIIHAAKREGKPRIGLVGHLDVVRSEHDKAPRIEGDRLYGPGAADMKSGLAVMIELAERLDLKNLPYDLTLVFYEREEGPYEENRLGDLLRDFESLRTLDFAIALEPSDNKLQLGCMGSLQAKVTFRGRTAHSARPWQGENAIYKALPFLHILSHLKPKDVHLDGLLFREVVTPTLVHGGRSRNIVPDIVDFNVNYRFAPGRSPEEACRELQSIAPDAEVVMVDGSPAGIPHGNHILVKRLIECGVEAVESKQAWTDVGRFSQVGVPAVNFGPGTQAQAHQRNEYTYLPPLEKGYEILRRFLSTSL